MRIIRIGGPLLVFAALLVACPTSAERTTTERPYGHTISTDDDEAHKETGEPSRHVIGAD